MVLYSPNTGRLRLWQRCRNVLPMPPSLQHLTCCMQIKQALHVHPLVINALLLLIAHCTWVARHPFEQPLWQELGQLLKELVLDLNGATVDISHPLWIRWPHHIAPFRFSLEFFDVCLHALSERCGWLRARKMRRSQRMSWIVLRMPWPHSSATATSVPATPWRSFLGTSFHESPKDL